MSFVGQKECNVRSITSGKVSWFYIEKPTSNEVEFLAQRFGFHPLDVDDVLSRVQRPKIDEYRDYLFMVLHFPVFGKQSRTTKPSEVDIFRLIMKLGNGLLCFSQGSALSALKSMLLREELT